MFPSTSVGTASLSAVAMRATELATGAWRVHGLIEAYFGQLSFRRILFVFDGTELPIYGNVILQKQLLSDGIDKDQNGVSHKQ